ncbi:hypothetical protein DFR69_1261, partial [Nocardia neocaledoniensis]
SEPPKRRGVPRWVIIGGIGLAVIAILMVVMMLAGGGEGHGPGRHGGSGNPPAGVSHTSPPPGAHTTVPGASSGAVAPPAGHVPPSGAHG